MSAADENTPAGPDGDGPEDTDDTGVLARLRTDTGSRRLATLAGLVVGLGLAQVHWLGLVVGGALVALPQRTIPRALLVGLTFGIVAWLAFLAGLWATGDVDSYAEMGRVALLAAAIPIGMGLFGGLSRTLG